jgi:hypothetical protein
VKRASSRINWTDVGITTAIFLIPTGILIASIAASFTHIKDWALRYAPPNTDDWQGWAFASTVELVPIFGVLVLWKLKKLDHSLTVARWILGSGFFISMAGQVAYAGPNASTSNYIVAAGPSIAGLVLTEVLLWLMRVISEKDHVITATTTAAPVIVPERVTPTLPTRPDIPAMADTSRTYQDHMSPDTGFSVTPDTAPDVTVTQEPVSPVVPARVTPDMSPDTALRGVHVGPARAPVSPFDVPDKAQVTHDVTPDMSGDTGPFGGAEVSHDVTPTRRDVVPYPNRRGGVTFVPVGHDVTADTDTAAGDMSPTTSDVCHLNTPPPGADTDTADVTSASDVVSPDKGADTTSPNDDASDLDPQILEALEMRNGGATYGSIAAHFGKSDRTIMRWLKGAPKPDTAHPNNVPELTGAK